MSFGRMKICHETEYEVEVHWEIENFLSYLSSDLIKTSPSFTWSSISWELRINYDSADNIELFLRKGSCDKKLPVLFKFGIQLIDGTTEFRCNLNRTFDSSVNGFGTHELIKKSEVVERKYELLHAKMLTISCLMTHLATLTKPQNVKYEGKCGL